MLLSFFFFQAEDGIRDLTVTGVQTCALPISISQSGYSARRGKSDGSLPHQGGSLDMNEHVTLMHPDARDPTARAISSAFPIYLLSPTAGRLRVLALLYAFVFFMAGIFTALLLPADRGRSAAGLAQWAPA